MLSQNPFIIGLQPAAALLEARLAAVGHYCARDGAAAPRWIDSWEEARTIYPRLAPTAAAQAQWERTLQGLRAAGAAPQAPERPVGPREHGGGWWDLAEQRHAVERKGRLWRW